MKNDQEDLEQQWQETHDKLDGWDKFLMWVFLAWIVFGIASQFHY